MTICFIIPVYNTKEEKLKRCVKSIVDLRCAGIEKKVLLVDDGSQKEIADLCDEISDEWRDIRCVHKKNGGASEARNYGIDNCDSDYIYFVDSDDVIIGDGFEAITINDEDIIFTDISVEYRKKEILWKVLDKPSCKIEIESILKRMVVNGQINGPVGKIIRTSFLNDNRIRFPQNIIMGEDAVFLLRMLKCDPVMSYNDISTYRYYREEYTNNNRLLFNTENYINSMIDYWEEMTDVLQRCHVSDVQTNSRVSSLFTRFIFNSSGELWLNHRLDLAARTELLAFFERVNGQRTGEFSVREMIEYYLLRMKVWLAIGLITKTKKMGRA